MKNLINKLFGKSEKKSDTSGTNPSNPLVSVVIPLYNHEKYIETTVKSVLNQSLADLELIIIDDGSKDSGGDIVNKIKDNRTTYIYQENQGAHNTINRGIKMTKGKYVAILNSDDVYKTDKLKKSVKVMEDNPNIQAVFSDFDIVHHDGSLFRPKGGSNDNWLNNNSETSFKGQDNVLLNLLAGNYLATTSNLICRKSVFDDIGYFINLRYSHDYEFFLKLCATHEVHYLKESLFDYRIHDANTISESPETTNFEVALTLAEFFLEHDFASLYKGKLDLDGMTRFFNSVRTFHTDKIMMFVILFCIQNGNQDIIKELRYDLENPLRKIMIDYLKTIYFKPLNP